MIINATFYFSFVKRAFIFAFYHILSYLNMCSGGGYLDFPTEIKKKKLS